MLEIYVPITCLQLPFSVPDRGPGGLAYPVAITDGTLRGSRRQSDPAKAVILHLEELDYVLET